ncbi:hypothetical protein B0H19DRAFT_973062, partial [Mycena capillaripes]
VIAFVMDNATNNDTLVEHFAARCRSSGIPFSEENGRMRCMPHIIHLAALQVRFGSPLLDSTSLTNFSF